MKTPSRPVSDEQRTLHRPLKLKLTALGKHYLVVNFADKAKMPEYEAKKTVKWMFERGKFYVMQLRQLQGYVGDPSEATGTLIVPKSLAWLSRAEAVALKLA